MARNFKENSLKPFMQALAFFVIFSVGLLPLFFYSSFSTPVGDALRQPFKIALLIVPVIAVLACYRCEPSRNKLPVFILLVLLTLMLVDIHYLYIDRTSNYFGNISNHQWQVDLHENILKMSPEHIPHSYRFLPDSLTRIFEFLTGDFGYARSLYRHTFMFLLLFSIYYYARLYCGRSAAILSVLFYAAVYPISIRFYAGQLTDPMSHMLFVWSFIFIEKEKFALFSLTVLFGILAKETIVIMPVFYLLLRLNDMSHILKSLALIIISAGLAFFVRLMVASGIEYENISGVSSSHILNNLAQYEIWGRQLAYTVGIFIPFLVLAWNTGPKRLRNLVLFLLPPLIISNIVFSWFHESRNFIPAVIPMAVIASDYLLGGTNKENTLAERV